MTVELYTWRGCRTCARALELLDEAGVDYVEHALGRDRARLRELQERFEHRGVPLVVVDGRFAGGLDELERMLRDGELG